MIQALAEETGGCVADSLEMARFGAKTEADIIIVAGVRFMGETAKILSPEKTVLMPTLEATCSLDLGCPADQFTEFCDAHPDHTVVVYANTSTAVKARADWIVTSSCALEIVDHLDAEGKKIIWGPDKHLGSYIEKQTGAEMLKWQGACIVHDEFKTKALKDLKAANPNAAVLVHPESPDSVVELGRRGRFHLPAHQSQPGNGQRHLHRRHRQRHLLQDAATVARQDLSRSPHGRRGRHLPQLRPLPLDGHERPGGHRKRA